MKAKVKLIKVLKKNEVETKLLELRQIRYLIEGLKKKENRLKKELRVK